MICMTKAGDVKPNFSKQLNEKFFLAVTGISRRKFCQDFNENGLNTERKYGINDVNPLHRI